MESRQKKSALGRLYTSGNALSSPCVASTSPNASHFFEFGQRL